MSCNSPTPGWLGFGGVPAVHDLLGKTRVILLNRASMLNPGNPPDKTELALIGSIVCELTACELGEHSGGFPGPHGDVATAHGLVAGLPPPGGAAIPALADALAALRHGHS